MGASAGVPQNNNPPSSPGALSANGYKTKYSVQAPLFPSDLLNQKLPDNFVLHITKESLDFEIDDTDGKGIGTKIIQFPYQIIISWGHSFKNFQFKIFNLKKYEDGRDSTILISLTTREGKSIEDATMATVKALMSDMEIRAISKEEFDLLVSEIFDTKEQLTENWLQIVDQFTSAGRLLLAKQGIDLLNKVSDLAPFEKVDLAVLLYTRIINKESYQLIINTFPDPQERGNLIQRLKAEKHNTDGLTTLCTSILST